MQIHERPGTSDHAYRDPLPPISELVFYGTSLLLSSQDDRASDGITTSANLYATSDLARRYRRFCRPELQRRPNILRLTTSVFSKFMLYGS
ncbi:hypothetical protein M405DRAFT_804312 [Rhizopogon salebrosus TDB-379]|nr:hypothetical protein M405DRAFT_804312 [Rhizopogon salebrosus TDB-379]